MAPKKAVSKAIKKVAAPKKKVVPPAKNAKNAPPAPKKKITPPAKIAPAAKIAPPAPAPLKRPAAPVAAAAGPCLKKPAARAPPAKPEVEESDQSDEQENPQMQTLAQIRAAQNSKKGPKRPSLRMMAEKMLGKAHQARTLKEEAVADSQTLRAWVNEAKGGAKRKEEEKEAWEAQLREKEMAAKAKQDERVARQAEQEAARRAEQEAKQKERQARLAEQEAARRAEQEAKERDRQAKEAVKQAAIEAAQKVREQEREASRKAKEEAAAEKAAVKAAEKEAQQERKQSEAEKLAATKAALEAMKNATAARKEMAAAKCAAVDAAKSSSSKARAQRSPEEVLEDLKKQIGASVRICVLGGTSFQCADTEEMIKLISADCFARVGRRAAFITGGMQGVQRSFASHCGDGSTVWNLLPMGQASGFSSGKDIHAGKDLEERKKFFGQIGDVYITFEGGPGVASEADMAFSRGAKIVPMVRTGGASCGMFDFPLSALDRPALASPDDWVLLTKKSVPVATSAQGAVNIIAKFVDSLAGPEEVVQDEEVAQETTAVQEAPEKQMLTLDTLDTMVAQLDEKDTPRKAAAPPAIVQSPPPKVTVDIGDVD